MAYTPHAELQTPWSNPAQSCRGPTCWLVLTEGLSYAGGAAVMNLGQAYEKSSSNTGISERAMRLIFSALRSRSCTGAVREVA